MRITVKPPSPAPSPNALVTLRVETADPRPLLAGPPSVAYEGRYAEGKFLFPAAGEEGRGVSMRTSAASDFRTPPLSSLQPHVDIPAHEGDTITATLITPAKTYSAALRAPAPGNNNTAPVELQLAEGGAAPPTPPTPGLTITPLDGEGDVLNLDPAPGNDNIVVVG